MIKKITYWVKEHFENSRFQTGNFHERRMDSKDFLASCKGKEKKMEELRKPLK